MNVTLSLSSSKHQAIEKILVNVLAGRVPQHVHATPRGKPDGEARGPLAGLAVPPAATVKVTTRGATESSPTWRKAPPLPRFCPAAKDNPHRHPSV